MFRHLGWSDRRKRPFSFVPNGLGFCRLLKCFCLDAVGLEQRFIVP